MVKTSCLSNTHHFLSLQSVGPQSPLFNISDCDQKIIPGNSGVAVLDKEGKMKGLFSFFLFKREDDQSLQSLLEKYLSDKIKDMKENVGGGTNALCISAESKEIPDRCDFDPHVNRRLGILHGYLSRQKKDPNVEALGSEIHQMNMENYDFIRFERIDPNEDLSDYISFNVHPPMEILKSYHLNKAFAFILPSFPECIDDSAENSFTARLGLRTPSFFEKHFVFASLNENHSSTIENKIEWESFLFERDEKEWIYKMTVAGETESLFTQILGLEYGHNFQLIVPFCE